MSLDPQAPLGAATSLPLEHAARLLSFIENRTAYIASEARLALGRFVRLEADGGQPAADGARLAPGAHEAPSVAPADFERLAPYWRSAVPDDPEVRAALAWLLASRHHLSYAPYPRVRTALGIDDPLVQDAHVRQFGEPVAVEQEAPASPEEQRPLPSTEADVSLADLWQEFEWVSLPRGELLCREGEPGDSMYILVNGRVRISVADEAGHEQVVGELGRGESVGEMALLTRESRTATVRAARDSELIKLPGAGFDRAVDKHPQLLRQLTRQAVARLTGRQRRAARGPAGQRLSTIALVPASRDAPLLAFAEQFVAACAAAGPTLHLSRARLDGHLGHGTTAALERDPSDGRVLAWLNEQESAHRFVVYEADREPSAWTTRCLRQADRVLIVAPADAEPQLGEIEQELFRAEEHGTQARADLVLLQADRGKQPTGTRRWLDRRKVGTHYHVHAGTKGDHERLVRFLTGQAVGLALSGGGARGFAHIGVIRALRELGIPIDYVCGTSMGSHVGGQCALGWDEATMIAMNRRAWVDQRPLADYTLPVVSMLSAQKIAKVLAMLYGETRIEDLWIKYFCVSSSLTRGQPVVHDQGLMRAGIRASGSVPGIWPPVVDGDQLLVDGGVLNNLPADLLARRWDGGRIIAVNVNPTVDLVSDFDYGDTLTARQLAARQLNPFRKRARIPNIHEILERMTMLGSVQQAAALAAGQVDLYLHPPTDEFPFLKFDPIETIAETGYTYSRGLIEAWQAQEKIERSAF